jgi:hypothetical protein
MIFGNHAQLAPILHNGDAYKPSVLENCVPSMPGHGELPLSLTLVASCSCRKYNHS